MRLRAVDTGVLMLLATVGAILPAAGGEHDQARLTSLRTIEGRVLSLSSTPAEGDLEVVTATLEIDEADLGKLEVLLAPKRVLEEIAFDVAAGDRIRAGVFVADEGPLKVHKAMNLTRGTMVRFRSLRELPLWNTTGAWDGGPCRRRSGQGGGHQGRGQGPRR
jgi:hypothetical protein